MFGPKAGVLFAIFHEIIAPILKGMDNDWHRAHKEAGIS